MIVVFSYHMVYTNHIPQLYYKLFMHKNLIYVLASFLSVTLIIAIGTNIAYRTNVITELKSDFQKKRDEDQQQIILKDERIAELKEELEIARTKQLKAEEKLKEKLDEEKRIQLEKEQKIKDAQIAAEKRAAEAARVAAEKAAKKASKKTKAS